MANQVASLKMEQKFKKTPAGEIPVDWEARTLGELCLRTPEYGANVSAIEFRPEWPRYVRITDIDDAGVLSAADRKSIKVEDAKPYLLGEGDIIFARSGATVGKTYLYRKSDGPCAFAGYTIRFSPNPQRLLPEFLVQFTHSQLYYQWVKGMLRAGAQPNINGSEYSGLFLPIPPLREQRKIAEILSAVDEAIEKMDAIIDRTWELKKGLVRKLFAQSKDAHHWKISSVGEYAQINSESLGNKTDPDAKLQYIDISSIERPGVISAVKDVVFKDAPSRARRVVKYGDILVSTVRPYLRAFARVKLEAPNLTASTGFAVLEPQPHIDGEFLYQFILSDQFVNFLEERMTGSNYPAVNPSDLAMCPIPLPPVEEQKAIGSILSAADRAVSCEEAYRDRLEAAKNSLMQLLLTGKVRT